MFELNAHPDAVEFVCKNNPLGIREAVIEQACLFVEGRSDFRLCRHQRTLQVCSMHIAMQRPEYFEDSSYRMGNTEP